MAQSGFRLGFDRQVRGKASAANVGLAVASLALCVTGVELGLRLLEDDRYYVLAPGTRTTFEPNPAYQPGVSGTARVTVNSLGMRGDELGDAPQYRLLAVGGSTTFCGELDDSEAWPHGIQDDLNEVLGAGSTWVGNVGRPGHGIGRHLLQVQRLLGQHPELDGILLLVGGNDLLLALAQRWKGGGRGAAAPIDPVSHAFAVVPRGAVAGPWYRRSALGDLVARRWPSTPDWTRGLELSRDGSHLKRWREARRRASGLLDSLPDLSPALRAYRSNLYRIADAAARHDARLILLTQPALWRGDLTPEESDLLWTGGPPLDRLEAGGEYYSAAALSAGMQQFNEVLLATCRERRVECIDLAAQLPRDATIFFDDLHFTERGARRLARLVTRYLLATPPLRDRVPPRG